MDFQILDGVKIDIAPSSSSGVREKASSRTGPHGDGFIAVLMYLLRGGL